MILTAREILVIDSARRNNADLIADAAAIGWIPEPVFDATYGLGRFWKKHRPEKLVTSDLETKAEHSWDWRQPIEEHSVWRAAFGSVVFDPPYKEQGTPSTTFQTMNTAYGTHVTRKSDTLRTLLAVGAVNCTELVAPGGFLLVKCQNQIVCGRYSWQTNLFLEAVGSLPGWKFESWLFLTHQTRPQRSQVKPRNNFSALMAFKRTR